MGDAVLRVQKHLQELTRDNFTTLETTHGRNIEWLRSELEALCKDIDIAFKLELKRPAPATYTSEYVFVAKKQKVTATTTAKPQEQEQEQVPAASQRPVVKAIPAAKSTESAKPKPHVREPAVEVVAQPIRVMETVKVKKLVKRTRKVMRPRLSSVAAKKQVKKERGKQIEPKSMKVAQLRAELKKRGLKAAGLKAVLVERLLEAIQEEDNSDDDDVVELEEIDEEYEEEVEEEVQAQSSRAASTTHASSRHKISAASSNSSSAPGSEMFSSPSAKSRDSSLDEIVRESDCGVDDSSLSQKSTADDSFIESTEKPKRALHQGAGAENGDADVTSGPGQVRESNAAPKKPTSRWALAASAARQAESIQAFTSTDERVPGKSERVQEIPTAASRRADLSQTDSTTGETDTSDMSIDLRAQASAQSSLSEKSSRATIAGGSILEKKPSMKVSFAARKDDTLVPDSQSEQRSTQASSNEPSADDPVSRSRSISLPQASVSTPANPRTPNGQMIADELQVARSEPAFGSSNDTEEDRREKEHQETIEREAQRLRIAAKLSAKKRFEEAKLSSAFWAKRDRLKAQMQTTSASSASDGAPGASTEVSGASKVAAGLPKSATVKAEPELTEEELAQRTSSKRMAAEDAASNKVPGNLAPSASAQQPAASSLAATASLKAEPASQARSKPVTIPFSSSNRRFSDPSRRLSASRKRESVASRRDSTSSRRDSVSSRRDSLTRRRDSGSSVVSSVSSKSKAESTKAAASGSRKPTNLVSGLHSFTSLMEKENSGAGSSARSAPVVNALKLAEKTRLLEQKKNLEKMKRKEALMKKYEEQRKLDDDKKKKTVGLKEKTERDAKLKREQDKMNEKKQREIELAKKRHQKLQEMRAGLEKKRAMLAAEKQAGAAKLAAQAVSSTRRISASSLSSQTSRATAPLQAAKSAVPSQVPKPTAASSQAVSASAASKTTKPSAPAQVSKPVLTTSQAASASVPVKKDAGSKQKDRPTDASTYDMSDNGESSGNDSDSDDEDKHNKKNIPKWARKENLERILRVQFGPNASDPSPAIFPDFVDTCDLEAIFQPTDVRKKKRFAKRSSSGNWFGDRPTAREKALYKRDMGYNR